MPIIKRTLDAVYALRFIRLLIMDWTEMDAYKIGLIDQTGKRLRVAKTAEEKSAYTLFHRLVFNIKRLIQKLPGSLTRKLGSWASALYLIKEEFALDEQVIIEELKIDATVLKESLNDLELAQNHRYILKRDIPFKLLDEAYAASGSSVVVLESMGKHFGHTIYKAKHVLTNQNIFICSNDVNAKSQCEEFSVTTQDVAMPAFPLKTKDGSIYRRFIVPTKLFQKFDKGREKYERWNVFLDTTDPVQTEIMEFAKKYRDATIILQDASTGAMRAIKPNNSSK